MKLNRKNDLFVLIAILIFVPIIYLQAIASDFTFEIGDQVDPKLENYENSIMVGLGARLPYSFWKRHQQTWVEFAWNKFRFGISGYKPHQAIDSNATWGNNPAVFVGTAGIKVFPLNEKRHFGPFAILKAGLLKRSVSVIRTNNLQRPYIKRNYGLAPAWAIGLGLRLFGDDSGSFEIDYSYTIGYTRPNQTSFGLVRWRAVLSKL